MKRYLLLAFSMVFVACTSGPCRSVKHPELVAQQTTAPGTATPTPPLPGPQPAKGPAPVKTPDASQTVFVYKPDGSLQCGQGKAIALAEMEKQLKGIKILSSENKPDGLMHIQVCGSPTGMINVFEIPATKLPEAEKRGFKKFEVR